MAFYHREILKPDDELLQMLDALGRQVGDFIKRTRAGKNERFDPLQPMRGEAPLAGGRARPAPACPTPLPAPMRRFDPKCVRKHTIPCRYPRRRLRQLRSALRNIKLLLDMNEISAQRA